MIRPSKGFSPDGVIVGGIILLLILSAWFFPPSPTAVTYRVEVRSNTGEVIATLFSSNRPERWDGSVIFSESGTGTTLRVRAPYTITIVPQPNEGNPKR